MASTVFRRVENWKYTLPDAAFFGHAEVGKLPGEAKLFQDRFLGNELGGDRRQLSCANGDSMIQFVSIEQKAVLSQDTD